MQQQQTTPQITTTKPLPTLKQADTPQQAALRVILSMKEVEGKGKTAKETRKQAEAVLEALVGNEAIITLDGNRSYEFSITTASRSLDAKILVALMILHPEIRGTFGNLKAAAEYNTAYQLYNVKRVKA